jgi:hypothetical protein
MTAAIVNRTRWFRRPWLLVLAVVLLMGVVAFVVSESARFFVYLAAEACVYGFPSNQDVKEAAAVKNTITAIHHFDRSSMLQRGSPPISSHPGSELILTKPAVVVVYDIRDTVEQNKVIKAVQNLIRDEKSKPVDLRFFDRENWIVNGNVGQRSGVATPADPNIAKRCSRGRRPKDNHVRTSLANAVLLMFRQK